jgi:hypothetical protein
VVAPKTAHIATHVVVQEASVIPALQRHQSKLMFLCSIQLEVGFHSISESFLLMEMMEGDVDCVILSRKLLLKHLNRYKCILDAT